jgi:hypothetical protein
MHTHQGSDPIERENVRETERERETPPHTQTHTHTRDQIQWGKARNGTFSCGNTTRFVDEETEASDPRSVCRHRITLPACNPRDPKKI